MTQHHYTENLITDYTRTLIRVKARQLCRRPIFRDVEQADVEQELTLYLLNQAEHYDPSRGAVATFVNQVVNSAAAFLVRDRKRAKRLPTADIEVESLTQMVDQPDGPPEVLESLVSRDDLQRRVGTVPLTDVELLEILEGVGAAIETLPPGLQRFCRNLMHGNGTSAQSAAGFSRRAYDAAMQALRLHFARAGLKKN